jgi:site-specific DNA-methyltransferase (adenine-specific)
MESRTTHRVFVENSLDALPELEDESIGFAVTSPPYWQIKDYEHDAQLGSDQPYEEYLDDLARVWEECHRLLMPGCRLAVNIGDQYLRASEYGRYRVQPIPADTIQIGRDLGFDFMGNIIWRKVSTTETTGGGSWMGSTYYPKDGHVTYEHEYILLFRKQGDWPRPTEKQKEKSRLTKEQRSRWFRGHWELDPDRQDDHEAKFPEELPRRLIKMYSFWGETVLDPFLGSGTTAGVARELGRDSVGVELNPDYRPYIEESLGVAGMEPTTSDSAEVYDTDEAVVRFEGAH